jgi:hypothetical protein
VLMCSFSQSQPESGGWVHCSALSKMSCVRD